MNLIWRLAMASVALAIGFAGCDQGAQPSADPTETRAAGSPSPRPAASEAEKGSKATTSMRTEPREGEVVFYRLHPDRSKIDKYCGAKDPSYIVRRVAIPTGERDALTRAVRALAASWPGRFADYDRDEFRPASLVTSVTLTDGKAVIDLRSMKRMGIVSATCAGVGFIGELSRTVFQFDSVDSFQIHLAGSCKDFGDFMQSGRCDTITRDDA